MRTILKISSLAAGMAYGACNSVSDISRTNNLNFEPLKKKVVELKDKVSACTPSCIKNNIIPASQFIGTITAPWVINYLIEKALPLCRPEYQLVDGKLYQFDGYGSLDGKLYPEFYGQLDPSAGPYPFPSYVAKDMTHINTIPNLLEIFHFYGQNAPSCLPLLACVGYKLGQKAYEVYEGLFEDIQVAVRQGLVASTIIGTMGVLLGAGTPEDYINTTAAIGWGSIFALSAFIATVAGPIGDYLTDDWGLQTETKRELKRRFQQGIVKFDAEKHGANTDKNEKDEYVCMICDEPLNYVKVFHQKNRIKHVVCENCYGKMDKLECPTCRKL